MKDLKDVFEELLAAELQHFEMEVQASYVISRDPFLIKLSPKGNGARIWINLKFYLQMQKFSGFSKVISVYFCVYYISDYLTKLMTMGGHADTYYEGVAITEGVIHMLSGKRWKAYPFILQELMGKRFHQSGCLEAFCETNSLLRCQAMFMDHLDQEQKKLLEHLVAERMLYLSLPEVMYERHGCPRLLLRDCYRELRRLAMKRGGFSEKIALFQGIEFRDDAAFIQSVSKKVLETSDPFWKECLLRLAVCSARARAAVIQPEVITILKNTAAVYRGLSGEFADHYRGYGFPLLEEDFGVIMKMERGIRAVFPEICPNTGGTHIVY